LIGVQYAYWLHNWHLTAGRKSVSAGNGQPLAYAAYYSQCQSAATSEVVKVPLSSIVSGAIISELPFTVYPSVL